MSSACGDSAFSDCDLSISAVLQWGEKSHLVKFAWFLEMLGESVDSFLKEYKLSDNLKSVSPLGIVSTAQLASQ